MSHYWVGARWGVCSDAVRSWVSVQNQCPAGYPCRGSAQLAGRYPVVLELSLCCSLVLAPAHPHISVSLVQPGSAGGDRLGLAELSPVWPQHLLVGTGKSCTNLSELK